MKKMFARFIHDTEGQDLIEYGLLIGIITVGTVAAIKDIGPIVVGYYTNLLSALNAA